MRPTPSRRCRCRPSCWPRKRSTALSRRRSPKVSASSGEPSTRCLRRRTRRKAWPPSSRSGRRNSPTSERAKPTAGGSPPMPSSPPAGARALRRREADEAVRYRDGDRLDLWLEREVIEDGHAAYILALDLGARVEFLHATLESGNHQEVGFDKLVVGLAVGRVLLHALDDRCERRARAGDPKSLDLHRAMDRLPAPAAGNLRRRLHELGGHAEARAGSGVVDHAPAGTLLLQSGGFGQLLAFLGIENPGILAAIALLERLDCHDRGVAEFHADDAVVVAGPDQVVLDRVALGLGHGRKGGACRGGGRRLRMRRSGLRDGRRERDRQGRESHHHRTDDSHHEPRINESSAYLTGPPAQAGAKNAGSTRLDRAAAWARDGRNIYGFVAC